jgi:hypothetical protein
MVISYFFSVALLGFMGAFFSTSTGINMFLKVLCILSMIIGVSAGIPLLSGGETHLINHVIVGIAGVLAFFFLFAKGDGGWAILVKMLCIAALILNAVYFTI